MINEYRLERAQWIDLESPSRDEVRDISDRFTIHPRIAEELLFPSPFSGFRNEDDAFLVTLFFPALRHTHTDDGVQEIDFVIKDNVIITTRYDTVDALHKFSKEFEVAAATGNMSLDEDSFTLFAKLARKLYKSVRHELEFILSDMKRIEEEMFSGSHKKILVEEVSTRSRMLLSVIHTLSLNRMSIERFGNALAHQHKDYEVDVINSILQAHDETHRFARDTFDALKELRETYYLVVSIKQNEVMKTLTVIASIMLPLSLIAGIFGMNTGEEYAIHVILGGMILITLLTIFIFKYKRWL